MRRPPFACSGLLGLMVLLLAPVAFAQPSNDDPPNRPQADPADVGSVDAIITAAYDVLSGPIGQTRDWDRARSLFHPSARLAHTQWQPGGESAIIYPMTHEDHINAVNDYTIEKGFMEKEIGREVVSYGTITHVFSTYEYTTEDESMYGRGINSFQLFFDGTRYWITSIIWSQEAPEHPIPDRFINKQ